MSDDGAARILVVDDVPENVRLLEAVLTPRGYEVVSATDGSMALGLAESAKPDLVVLDVMMPQPDGYTVCRQLRERDETAVLPVIMLTASDGPEKTKAIEAGADDFIAKPFNRDELLTRIRSLLRIKRYHDTIKAQAAELLELNRTLEERVRAQVEELERLRRLRRFLSPQSNEATGGQILIEQRLCAEVENDVDVEPVGEVTLKGFRRPVAAFNVVVVRDTAVELSPVESDEHLPHLTRRSDLGAGARTLIPHRTQAVASGSNEHLALSH